MTGAPVTGTSSLLSSPVMGVSPPSPPTLHLSLPMHASLPTHPHLPAAPDLHFPPTPSSEVTSRGPAPPPSCSPAGLSATPSALAAPGHLQAVKLFLGQPLPYPPPKAHPLLPGALDPSAASSPLVESAVSPPPLALVGISPHTSIWLRTGTPGIWVEWVNGELGG